ncbi:MAG: pyruvate formate-lyase 1-activating enzyme, partial [Bacillota bacterium]|nr:pyruvate formate-lyase 1-activating enzyme [Bacillota bacterium]
DSRENIDNLADFLKDNIRRLYKAELLGYHTMALNKYERLGMKYKLDGVKPMDKANLAKLQDCLDRDLMIS